MSNLADAVKTKSTLTASKSARSFRVCLTKADITLSASAEQVSKSKRFYLVRMPVRKLPLLSVDAEASRGPIFVDVNSRRRKATKSGFVPKVIVLRGLGSLQAAKSEEKLFCNVWAGEKVLRKLKISAEDSIGSNALQSKLNRLICDKYKNQKSSKAADNYCYGPTPWIEEVFPYDGYFVFRYDGETYRQSFLLNKETQEPTLNGEPVKAVVTYVPAINAASLADVLYSDSYTDKTMLQEMLFDKVNVSSPSIGSIGYSAPLVPDGTYYPAGSELARPELRTMLNVREALSIFLDALKNGTKAPLQIAFSPVNVPTDKFYIHACREASIVAKEANRKINVPQFVLWQHDQLTQSGSKVKYGLTMKAYAYIGDPQDISTWHLRCDSPERIQKSLRLVMRCAGVPENKREAIRGKLKALLKVQ